MGDHKNNKIVKYRKHSFFNIGTVMFGILFIYMIICFIMYLTTKHVTAYEVTSGPLAGNFRYTAIALKTETVLKAEQSGSVLYFAREGRKVGSGNSVCAIDPSGKLAQVAKSSTKELSNDADPDMLSRIRSDMSAFAADYNATSYQAVYNFKADIESSILELTSEKELSSLDADSAGSMVDLCNAPHEGIVIYSTDGYENLEAEEIKSSDFDQKSYTKKNLRLNKNVSVGADIYKLLTDENWSLVFPINEGALNDLSEYDNGTIRLRFLKDNTTISGNFSILHNKDGYYGKIDMRTSLIRYASDRFLEIELVTNRNNGLKIPKSAIATKVFFKIPKDFAIYKEETPKEISIICQEKKKNGGTSAKYMTATVYRKEEDYFLIDTSKISPGTVLLKEDSTKQYIVNETETLNGVYNINKGYAVFRDIGEPLDENEEYCIVDSEAIFGLSQYDHIALDATTVNDQDIIYK